MLAEGPQGLNLPGIVRQVPPSYLAVPEGLVGHWQMSVANLDIANNNLYDISGNGNTGALTNITTALLLDNGRLGNSISFQPGNNSVINVGTSSTLNPAKELTLTAWFYAEGTSSIQIIIARDTNTGTSRAYNFYINASDKIGMGIFKSDAGESNVTGATSITLNKWFFAAGTYRFVTDGTSVSTIYFNGEFDGQATNTVGPIQQTANRTTIGQRDYSGFNNPISARIASCRLYNRCLDVGEIKQLYALGWQGKNMADTRREMPIAFLPAAPVVTSVFRKTASRIGTRVGTRQTWAA